MMALWIAVGCAVWIATHFGLAWLHVYMQTHHGWQPLAESVPALSIDVMLAILGIGCVIIAAMVIILAYRGVLPDTSRVK